MSMWHLDEGFHLDDIGVDQVAGTTEFSMTTEYQQRPLEDREPFNAKCDFGISLIAASPIDLMRLVPVKFHGSQIMVDFLSEAGLQTGNWLTKVREIINLLNVRTVNDTTFLRDLGALIGVTFPPEDMVTVDDMKKTIINAIDWYKIKGTYKAVQIIALIEKLAVNVRDLWTNDYVTFIPVDWFVGTDGENPPGLDATYYKSPHFGIEILLNQVYDLGSGLGDHLWSHSYLDNLYDKIEELRPAHTVPHYILLLNPKTDEFGHVIIVDGEIKAKVTPDWEYSIKYLDEVGSGQAWSTDEGVFLDNSATGFIKSVTKWVLGVGGSDVSDSGFNIVPVLSGTIDPDDITITDEKITYDFTVPKASVSDSINELGLYIPGSPDTLVITSSFPKIDKDNRVSLRVIVEIYRKDLA